MAIRTLLLTGTDAHDIAEQARVQLSGFDPVFLLFFASSCYAAGNPAGELQRVFPTCRLIGSTSHSEYCGDQFVSHAVSLMAMDRDSIQDCCVTVVPNLRTHPDVTVPVTKMHDYFGGVDHIFDHFDQYVGLVLFEASAKSEEYFMDKLGNASDLLFVGGTSSTADVGESRVYADGESYADAAVLAVLRTVNGYDVIKTQSASIFSDRALTATRSDMSERILYEFDGRPCGEAYADVLGIAQSQVADYFVSNPLGVVSGEEIFVRTFNQIAGDGITLHCGIPEGTEIQVLKIGDIVEDTRAALDKAISYQPAGVVNFNCLYRTLEIQNRHVETDYCALFGRYPSIGFSTAGEALLGHINETSTILVIK